MNFLIFYNKNFNISNEKHNSWQARMFAVPQCLKTIIADKEESNKRKWSRGSQLIVEAVCAKCVYLRNITYERNNNKRSKINDGEKLNKGC